MTNTHAQARAAVSASPLPPATKPLVNDQFQRRATLAPADYDRAKLPEAFAAASHAFSDHANELRRRTHRAGTVLRLIQHYFLTVGNDEALLCEEDTAELIDLLGEIVPHHDVDISNPLDEFETAARCTLKDAMRREANLSEIIDAITIVARGDTSLEEIQEAAGKVYFIAKADPAYAPDFQRIVDIVELRGFTVTIEEMSGHDLGPRVDSEETLRAKRRTDKAVRKLVAEVNNADAIKRGGAKAKAGALA